MKLLLVQDKERPYHDIREEHMRQIKAVDPTIDLAVVSSGDAAEIERHLGNADVLAGTLWSIPKIHDTKNLKWIHSFSAGVDHVLTREVRESEVLLGNVSGIHAIPIAEHVLGFLLIFTKRFYSTFQNQREKIWEKNDRLTELRGKTVLIVGLGHIGEETGKILNCVGARVTAVDQPGRKKPDFVDELYPAEGLQNALPEADFVVLALPHTEATHHLFDMEKFRIMKKSSVLVNIGRGSLVHEEELIAALRQKIIAGAALDVTETEPLPRESPLWAMENVVITPHHSGISEKYMDRAVDVFCENLNAYLKGERLPNLVDKQRGY